MPSEPGPAKVSSKSRQWIAWALRSVEAAAIAGLLHSVLSILAMTWLLRAPGLDESEAVVTEWYGDADNQRLSTAALSVLVMSVVAFLWFVAVLRRRVGSREDPFFGTVFLGSALLLSAAWMAAAVLFVAPIMTAQQFGQVPQVDTIATFQSAGLTMASVVATRLEAIFVIATTTVGRVSGVARKSMVVVGYIVGFTLLLVPVPAGISTYAFPVWVALISALMFIRRAAVEDESGPPAALPTES